MMKVLVLQRGHVPRTSGSTGTEGEQDLAHAVAAHAREQIERTDWEISVIDADEPSHRYFGNAFVAVHADGSEREEARGASVGYRTPEGRDLGQVWKHRYARAGWPGPWRADNYTRALAGYYGTRRAVSVGNRRAIIIESGFLTNPTDRAWLVANPHRISAAILSAVTDVPVEDFLRGEQMPRHARISGPNRAATAARFARERWQRPGVVYLAKLGSPDGVVSAAPGDGPILHADESLPPETEAYLRDGAHHIGAVYVVGGPGVVSDAAYRRAVDIVERG